MLVCDLRHGCNIWRREIVRAEQSRRRDIKNVLRHLRSGASDFTVTAGISGARTCAETLTRIVRVEPE